MSIESVSGFLFDENLPRNNLFTPSKPVTHSASLGINPSDEVLWDYARRHCMVIVTKDADFSNRIMMSQAPPWIVHLRFGNLRRRDFHALLAKVWPQIEALLPGSKLICVYHDRIESFGD